MSIYSDYNNIEKGFIRRVKEIQIEKEYKFFDEHSFTFKHNSFTFRLGALSFSFSIVNNSNPALRFSYYCGSGFLPSTAGTNCNNIPTLLNWTKNTIQEIKNKNGVFMSPVSLFVEYLEEYVKEVY